MRLATPTASVLLIATSMLALVVVGCGSDPTPVPTAPATPVPTAAPTPTPLPPGVPTLVPTSTPAPSPTPTPLSAAQQQYLQALDEFKAVEAAAREEGRVVIYMSPSRNEPITTTRIEAFNEAYPEITVDVIGVSNAGHLERARAEAAIGRREADVGESGATVIFQHWEDGLTINYTPPALLDPNVSWAIFPKVDGPESGVMFSRLLAYFLFVNTRLVPPEERPKSYLELTDAKWKDKCAVRDPSRRGGGNHLFSALRDYHGTDIMRALFENCTVIASGTELARSVARGDHLVSSPVNVGNLVTFQDAPVDLILPEEGGLSILSGGMALYKDPPHPNAAKVWANFWLTKPGQDIFGTETTPFMEEANVGHPLLDPSVPRLPGTPYGNEWAVNQAVNEIDIATTMLEELGKR